MVTVSAEFREIVVRSVAQFRSAYIVFTTGDKFICSACACWCVRSPCKCFIFIHINCLVLAGPVNGER